MSNPCSPECSAAQELKILKQYRLEAEEKFDWAAERLDVSYQAIAKTAADRDYYHKRACEVADERDAARAEAKALSARVTLLEEAAAKSAETLEHFSKNYVMREILRNVMLEAAGDLRAAIIKPEEK